MHNLKSFFTGLALSISVIPTSSSADISPKDSCTSADGTRSAAYDLSRTAAPKKVAFYRSGRPVSLSAMNYFDLEAVNVAIHDFCEDDKLTPHHNLATNPDLLNSLGRQEYLCVSDNDERLAHMRAGNLGDRLRIYERLGDSWNLVDQSDSSHGSGLDRVKASIDMYEYCTDDVHERSTMFQLRR